MRMKCPVCGAKINSLEAVMEEDMEQCFRTLALFGDHGTLVFEYVELFGVHPLRMRAKKLLRLFKEVAVYFFEGVFGFNSRKYSISKPGVIEAIAIVNNKHFEEPLEKHNYLKKVMITVSARRAKEESIRKERELRKKEDRLRSGAREQMGEEGQSMTAKEYLAKIGKKSLREK